jgi:hypothetical protein
VKWQTRHSCDYPVYRSLPGVLDDKVQLILHNYVPRSELQHGVTNSNLHSPRICGAWVRALPELTVSATGAPNECLALAINALALSITALRTGRNLLQPISSQYEHTLSLLQRDLQMTGHVYKAERVAAMMCLTLLEVEAQLSSLFAQCSVLCSCLLCNFCVKLLANSSP